MGLFSKSKASSLLNGSSRGRIHGEYSPPLPPTRFHAQAPASKPHTVPLPNGLVKHTAENSCSVQNTASLTNGTTPSSKIGEHETRLCTTETQTNGTIAPAVSFGAPRLPINFVVGRSPSSTSSQYITQRLFRVHPRLLSGAKALLNHQTMAHSSHAIGCKNLPNANDISTVYLQDFDPHAFEMWLEYATTGIVQYSRGIPGRVTRTHNLSWEECWGLIDAHVLGTMIEHVAFADYVVDLLREKLKEGMAPDQATIQHVFTKQVVGARMKEFVVDRALEAGIIFEADGIELPYPAAFLRMALQRVLRRDDKTQIKCRYHCHGEEEECWRELRTQREGTREGKLWRTKMSHTKEQCEATENARKSNVKIMDWACVRSEAPIWRDKCGKWPEALFDLEEQVPVCGPSVYAVLPNSTVDVHTTSESKEKITNGVPKQDSLNGFS